MPHVAIGARGRQASELLSVVEGLPGRGNHEETGADEHEAEKMERPGMRIGLPAEHHLKKMAGVVGKPVDVRIIALQPSGDEIDCKRKSVHFRK